MRLHDLVEGFPTTPFLFMGSGMTMRYLGLPNWKSLLVHFARQVSDDEFAYNAYEQRAKQMDNPEGVMPRIAELIENDYNERWYADKTIRTLDESELECVRTGTSPFKAEIASYIKKNSQIKAEYQKEVVQLEKLAERNLSGVITTNYDSFIEDHFSGYKTYVGQGELIFSAIQGIAEIYKIHGSVSDPSSIVIDEQDYEKFDNQKAYLAAKLMTIFVEYPIIFMGYSLSDSNIRKIIESIVRCLTPSQLSSLKNRFIFVEYVAGKNGVDVMPVEMVVGDETFPMTKIVLSDFSLLYDQLALKESKLPVRLLRHFKQDLYEYVMTNNPTETMRVASIDDTRVSDDDLVLAIGKTSDIGIHGLSGINGDEWYRNIVLGDLKFSADELLQNAFFNLLSKNSGYVPVNKLLFNAKNKYPEIEQIAQKHDFEHIISNTIKKNRSKYPMEMRVSEIWDNYSSDLRKATDFISYLTQDQIDVDELEQVLKTIFNDNPNVLSDGDSQLRTNIRRLIKVYDVLKWGK